MKHPFSNLRILAASCLLGLAASVAGPAATIQAATQTGVSADIGIGPHDAAEISRADSLLRLRPVLIFADSPDSPEFIHQLQLVERDLADLAGRDVVVLLDSDSRGDGEWRRALRPRGFSLVILDKDLRPVARKPSPMSVREMVRTIDSLPSRRQELLGPPG